MNRLFKYFSVFGVLLVFAAYFFRLFEVNGYVKAIKNHFKNPNKFGMPIFKGKSIYLADITELATDHKRELAFETKNDLTRQRGILSEGLRDYVARHIKLPIDKYIDTIVTQVMQEHTIVAIGKMGNSNSDLRKFIFEDGRVVLVEIRYPNQTNPRIDSLYNFLQDMSYIDSEGQLTDIAYNYIENYGKE